MKYNTKYGVVAALTLAAFVAPSVSAYTAGTPNVYTEAEQKKIDSCVASVNLKDKVETTANSTKYNSTPVANTIYASAAYSSDVTLTSKTLTEIKTAVCVVDLTVNGTLVDMSGVATEQAAVAAEQQKLAKINGGGRKSLAVDDTLFDADDTADSNDNADAATSKWFKDGVYEYKGNYKGDMKLAEEAVKDAKTDVADAKKALLEAEKDLAAAKNTFKAANPSADEDTIKDAVATEQAAVEAAQDVVYTKEQIQADAEKAVSDLKDDKAEAESDLKDAQAELKKAEAAAKKDAAKAVSDNAKAAAKDADEAVEALEEEIAQLKDDLKTANAASAKTINKQITEKEKDLKELKTKASNLNKIANNAATAAETITDEAREALSIASATVSGVNRAYTYTGKTIAPAVTVTKAGTTLVAGTDYTVGYSNNTKVGTATITISGKGEYTGTVTKSFYIDPAKSSIKKVSVGAKKMTVTVKKGTKATGVQIGYRVKGTSKWSYTKTTSTSKTIKSLKKGKKYQVVVRSYTTNKSGKITNYSGWSATKTSAKIK